MHTKRFINSNCSFLYDFAQTLPSESLFNQALNSLDKIRNNEVIVAYDNSNSIIGWVICNDRRIVSVFSISRKKIEPLVRAIENKIALNYKNHNYQNEEEYSYVPPQIVNNMNPHQDFDIYSEDTRQNNYVDTTYVPKKKKRRSKAPWIITIIIVLLLIAGGFYCYYQIKNAPDNDPTNPFSTVKSMIAQAMGKKAEPVRWQIAETGTAEITVVPGDTIVEVREKLYDAGFATTANQLYELLEYYGSASNIQIGTYQLFGSELPEEIVNRLLTGKTVPYGILGINNGDTIFTIANRIDTGEYPFTGEEFLAELQDPQKYKDDYKMLEAIPVNLPSLEGFIPSGEFNLRTATTAEEAVRILLNKQEEHYKRSDMTPQEYFNNLIIASMIDKEVLFDSEKPLVSSVIHNRLAHDWTLGIDATIKYATGSDEPRVLYEDTLVESPYNTYLNKGLPIGPISSGISQTSFSAAVSPADTTYMYYVLEDLEGHHAFSDSEDKFNADKAHMLELFGYDD